MSYHATADCETRSECSIKSSGSWKYSLDPTTEVLCFAYRLPYWQEGRVDLWHPAFPHLDLPECQDVDSLTELFTWVMDGKLVEAHNVFFEIGIWQNIMVPRWQWPEMGLRQWRCSAAKAASHALPRGLEDANDALHLDVVKDIEGGKLMKKMTKPRKPLKSEVLAWRRKHSPCMVCGAKGKIKIGRTKAQPCQTCSGLGWLGSEQRIPPMPTLYHESVEQMARLWDYCRQDVLAEEALSKALPDLSEEETEVFLLDLAVNVRGFQLDPVALATANTLIDEEFVDLNAELKTLTGGQVEKATQRAKMMEWFGEQGLTIYDTQAATIDGLLEQPELYPPHIIRGLELMRQLGRSSTAKYDTMSNWICPDNRVHGGILYHGAATGRWSGKGVQPHNFPRGVIKDQEALWTLLGTLDRERIMNDAPIDKEGNRVYTSIMDALAQGLRGVIVPRPGFELFVADYAAIEARVLLWLADDQDALDIFRRHEDIYCDMATSIYGYPTNKKDHPNERALGKVAVLGLGYQMGPDRFIEACMTMAGIEISEDLAKQTVTAYREKYWRVKNMWWQQEQAAIKAMKRGGSREGYITWALEGDFLYCYLPSGRRLAYPYPMLKMRMMPWGEEKLCLSFMGINQYNRKWERQFTYGGSLVENQTQAVARDLMAAAMVRAERHGLYEVILSVHDELIAEAPTGRGDVKEFEALMSECPAWATGCPVETEGWKGSRYRK